MNTVQLVYLYFFFFYCSVFPQINIFITTVAAFLDLFHGHEMLTLCQLISFKLSDMREIRQLRPVDHYLIAPVYCLIINLYYLISSKYYLVALIYNPIA